MLAKKELEDSSTISAGSGLRKFFSRCSVQLIQVNAREPLETHRHAFSSQEFLNESSLNSLTLCQEKESEEQKAVQALPPRCARADSETGAQGSRPRACRQRDAMMCVTFDDVPLSEF